FSPTNESPVSIAIAPPPPSLLEEAAPSPPLAATVPAPRTVPPLIQTAPPAAPPWDAFGFDSPFAEIDPSIVTDPASSFTAPPPLATKKSPAPASEGRYTLP